MKKLLLILTLLLISACNITPKVCFEDLCFNVELAKTQQEKETGLMFKEYLNENQGILFINEEEKISSVWMKNTKIPLDIIWLNSDLEIVFISKDVKPCLQNPCDIITPNEKSKYILEVNSGKTNNLNIGDKAYFNYK